MYKFRVWDCDFKKMSPLHEASFVDGVIIGAKGINWDSKVVIMQYTGLTDKNGVEIYEMDIIKKGEALYLVLWVEQRASFEAQKIENGIVSYSGKNLSYLAFESEVVGNVYQNPNLLKGKNER
jgi:uncharacterized phage protein (TIGR01671 family)